MDMLKQFFPFSFTAKNDVTALVVNVIIYLAAGVLICFAIELVSFIPLIGFLLGLVSGLVNLYILVGIVLSCLDYFKVLK